MKTVAVLISKASDLHMAEEPFKPKDSIMNAFDIKLSLIQDKVKQVLGDIPIDRLYFGNESCQFLMPCINEVEEVFSKATDRGLKATLVTPYVTNYGMEKLDEILKYVDSNYPEAEVVFNDWGVMYLIKQKYPNLKCIAGRLVDKMFREPRLSKSDYKEFFSDTGVRYMRRPNLTAKPYQELLKSYNIDRAELDNVPQGFDFEKDEVPVKLSLYLPFASVTSGRHCMMRMLTYKDNEKFIFEDDACKKQCQVYDQMMVKQVGTIQSDYNEDRIYKVELFRKGNSVFCANMDNLGEIVKNECFDRIIYQPTIPI